MTENTTTTNYRVFNTRYWVHNVKDDREHTQVIRALNEEDAQLRVVSILKQLKSTRLDDYDICEVNVDGTPISEVQVLPQQKNNVLALIGAGVVKVITGIGKWVLNGSGNNNHGEAAAYEVVQYAAPVRRVQQHKKKAPVRKVKYVKQQVRYIAAPVQTRRSAAEVFSSPDFGSPFVDPNW